MGPQARCPGCQKILPSFHKKFCDECKDKEKNYQNGKY